VPQAKVFHHPVQPSAEGELLTARPEERAPLGVLSLAWSKLLTIVYLQLLLNIFEAGIAMCSARLGLLLFPARNWSRR
jgi:hypothetical protein